MVCASGNRSTTACTELAAADIPAATLTGGTTAWAIENVATVLSKAGFVDRDMMMVINMIDVITIGASLDLVSPQDLHPSEVLAETTTLARIKRSAPSDVPRADAAFEFTVELVIEALGARLERSHPAHPAA